MSGLHSQENSFPRNPPGRCHWSPISPPYPRHHWIPGTFPFCSLKSAPFPLQGVRSPLITSTQLAAASSQTSPHLPYALQWFPGNPEPPEVGASLARDCWQAWHHASPTTLSQLCQSPAWETSWGPCNAFITRDPRKHCLLCLKCPSLPFLADSYSVVKTQLCAQFITPENRESHSLF